MRLRLVIPGPVLVVAAALAALAAARATSLLDDLETALQDSLPGLQADTSKAGLKKVKAVQSILAKLDTETSTDLEDFKLLKKVAGTVEKKLADEEAIQAALADTVDLADADVGNLIEDARGVIDGVEEGKAKTKLTKLVDKAEATLLQSRTKSTRKATAAGIYKARKLAKKAVERAVDLQPAGEDLSTSALVMAPNAQNVRTVFRVDFPGGTKTPLTNGTSAVFTTNPVPIASYDRTSFACRAGTQILLGTYEGSVALTPNAEWFFLQFSPDSTRLAACGSNPDVLAVFDMEGGTVFTSDDAVLRTPGVAAPVIWSPDGNLLAFRTDRDGDGTQEMRVLDLAEGSTVDASGGAPEGSIFKSFDFLDPGTLLYRRDLLGTIHFDRLEIGNLTGGDPLPLIASDRDVRSSKPIVHNGVILYVYEKDNDQHLATVGTDGSGGAELATGNSFGSYDWADDGSRVAYIADGALHTVTPAGTGDALVSATCPDFTWTGEAGLLLFREGPGGSSGNDLFVSDPDGGRKTKISPDLVEGGDTELSYIWAAEVGGEDPRLDVTMVSDDVTPGVRRIHQALVDLSTPAIEYDRTLIQELVPNAEVAEIASLSEVVQDEDSLEEKVVKYFLAHESLTGRILFCSITYTWNGALLVADREIGCAEFSGYFYDFLTAKRTGPVAAGKR